MDQHDTATRANHSLHDGIVLVLSQLWFAALCLTLVLWSSDTKGQACEEELLGYTPCTVQGVAAPNETVQVDLTLEIDNPGANIESWILAPALSSDPSCSSPNPGGTWSSYAPFTGQVPPNTTLTVPIVVTMDSATSGLGEHTEFACFFYDAHAEPIAIPVVLSVTDDPVCEVDFLSYTPCTVQGVAAPNESVQVDLTLEIDNPGASIESWIFAPALSSDPSCSSPNPGGTWSSYAPFTGQVPPNTTLTVPIVVTMDSAISGLGEHTEFACFFYDAHAGPIAIPIVLMTANILMSDGFESVEVR